MLGRLLSDEMLCYEARLRFVVGLHFSFMLRLLI